jgi:hypothetical protein
MRPDGGLSSPLLRKRSRTYAPLLVQSKSTRQSSSRTHSCHPLYVWTYQTRGDLHHYGMYVMQTTQNDYTNVESVEGRVAEARRPTLMWF